MAIGFNSVQRKKPPLWRFGVEFRVKGSRLGI